MNFLLNVIKGKVSHLIKVIHYAVGHLKFKCRADYLLVG